MSDYILLDRSGSMGTRWAEALSGVNAYVKASASSASTATVPVTVAVFDCQIGLQFNVIRKGVPSCEFKPLTEDDATPRGQTPLYDAVARIVSLAESEKPEKAVIIIMTDGEENSSREVTRLGAKAALDRARKRGWQIVFLGVDFENFAQGSALGNAVGQTYSVDASQTVRGMQHVNSRAKAYYSSGKEFADFSDVERAEVKK